MKSKRILFSTKGGIKKMFDVTQVKKEILARLDILCNFYNCSSLALFEGLVNNEYDKKDVQEYVLNYDQYKCLKNPSIPIRMKGF